MAVKFRDYYEVLGVDRDASHDEIRKAFRKLARKYHPDVAEDKLTAEEKFKELNEAYEVLGDTQKRETYDALGPEWAHGSDFGPPPGARGESYGGGFPGAGGGAQYEYHFGGSTGFSDFFESVFGARTAGDPFGAFRGNQRAGGRPDMPSRGSDIETDLLVTLEEVMTGAERQLRLRRPDSSGGTKDTSVKVHIPKGISKGQLIRCAGIGQEGSNGGEPGDLFLRVRLERHPIFDVKGPDLHMELELTPWEAVLGAQVPVRSLHGPLNLKIPSGTQPGTQLRVRGKGLPEHADRFGDLYINVHVQIPEDIDDDERELWESLAQRSRFRPRDP